MPSSASEPWGWHVSVDFIGAPIELITSVENFENFVTALTERTGMQKFGPLEAYHFAEHNPEAAGFSFNQFQATSNICGHLVDKNGGGFIDCFSCRHYDEQQVVDIIVEFFKPTKIKSRLVERTYPE